MCDRKALCDLSERLHVKLEWIQSIEKPARRSREWKNVGEQLENQTEVSVNSTNKIFNFYFFCVLSAFFFFLHEEKKTYSLKESLKTSR